MAIVRLSGSAAGPALRALTERPLPAPRVASLRLFHVKQGGALDRGLALWLPAPGSFTGEDVVEMQVHGGRAVVAGLLEALLAQPGVRLAEPGEFTRRAFDNGKLDLTQAEALADLVAAETAAQRRQALRQLDGGLSRRIAAWASRLTRSLARVEASLDFADEADVPLGLDAAGRRDVMALSGELAALLAEPARGEMLREGLSVAIVGPPNAGKSTLLNALARRDVAIVAATAGTTRDVLEVSLDLKGYPVILADTAGLRQASDAVEQEGVRRALARAEAADLRLVVLDATAAVPLPPEVMPLLGADSIVVLNTQDAVAEPPSLDGLSVLPLSARQGTGLPALLERLVAEAEKRLAGTETAGLTRLRHRQAVSDCLTALRRAEAAPTPELLAEDLRLALRALGRIVGQVDVEDVLGLIFAEFCIGK